MFTGYSPETVDFLWGIRMNNNREWFLAHKADYVKYLYEPTKALGAALFEPFLEEMGTVCKVSRIYRDARMHHPVPYKESLWVCIRRDVAWWGEHPCLYFEINPDGIHYGFFLWKPRPAMMKVFRKEIAARPEPFLQMVAQVEKATGVTVEAKEYKHPEKWENPALERFYRWKEQIGCTVQLPFSEATFGPELARRVSDFLQKARPLFAYFNDLEGKV